MEMMRVAVVGGGISGLVAAYVLAKDGAEVVLYEKEDSLGGHAKTVTVNGNALDLGFMVFSQVTCPNMMELFETLAVDMELSDMSSFSTTCSGLSSLFAQKKNILNPCFWKIIREITKFKNDASNYVEKIENNADVDRNETLGHFLQLRGYSELFQKAFLIPTCATIWSCSSEVTSFSAYSVLPFLLNHHTFELFNCRQRLIPRWHSQSFITRTKEELQSRGCQIRTNSEIYSVLTNDTGCVVMCKDGSKEVYDGCIIATHAPDALKMLGKQATYDELRILGAFQYANRYAYLLPFNIHSLSFTLKKANKG
ncbi:Polyenoic fatty acid isomerase [Handroanthus impetiginosus]|uniref:Polyenoic fatty acid isomerase n=1 Tax=Handroanthus impetiginosus TaxID=429701 RepID=A0A2G9G2T3_9LAMI|nr:Polyenoic fatty acid isomerase [Handroanthus impetiginosus]